jgi:peptide/nickel transport system substrate-binding protein
MEKMSEYQRLLETGAISRRQFVKYLMGAGLSLSAATLLLNSTASVAMASEPVRGGRLRIAFEAASQKETLDPAKRYSMTDRSRNRSLYNNLVGASPDLISEPELAESWEANKSADEWVFKLRKGIQWHDGKDLRAEDVTYSLNRVIDPKTGSGGRSFLSNVAPEGIKVVDPHTVSIKLNEPDVDFPFNLSSDFLAIVPNGKTDFDNAVGTGAFKLKSFKAGHGSLHVRNPNYWKSGLPYVDEVETFSIPDSNARVNALLSGDIHLMSNLDPTLASRVKAAPNAQVLATPSSYRVPFVMNTTMPPFDNPDVRLALKLLVDRDRYNRMVYGENVQIGNDQPISPIYPDHCDSIVQRQYDPDKAKALMKKAGALDTTFELHFSGVGLGAAKGALVFSEMAKKIGVKVKPVQHPTDGYWDAVWLKKSFCMCDWLMRPTANMALSIAFAGSSSWNDTFWKRPRFDEMLLESKKTFDKAKRRELYCEMQQMINGDGGQIITSFPNLLDGASDKVKNIILNPMATLGSTNIQEACWIAS